MFLGVGMFLDVADVFGCRGCFSMFLGVGDVFRCFWVLGMFFDVFGCCRCFSIFLDVGGVFGCFTNFTETFSTSGDDGNVSGGGILPQLNPCFVHA